MNDFVLPIFPAGSLDNSVITATWVGVMVCVFFNLRFGWALSGLVVPGYLAPLMIIKPWSAAVIGIESIVTYGIVWLFSEFCPRFGWWSGLFGRDRFFALILVGVAVRLGFDGWMLPAVGEWAVTQWGLALDYRNNLHSIGLVVVVLLANQFWKTGLARGLGPAAAMIGLTWLIVRFGLMEFTNFRISDIGLLYEDLAESLLSTPKAYMVLVLTALLASRFNLRYGWDFSGILIPSLIALQWYQPSKILVSVAEAFIIVGLASLVLRLPGLSGTGIEGARKLRLFFNVGFAYKMALAAALPLILPDEKVSDYFAFGYLLSTLIALKIHEKEILGRLTFAVVEVSAVGAGAATIAGFALTLVPPLWEWSAHPQKANAAQERAPAVSSGTLADLIRHRALAAYAVRGDRPLPPMSSIGPFMRQMRALHQAVQLRRREAEHQATAALQEAGFNVREIEGRYVVIDAPGNLHWGTFVLDRRSAKELVLEVPDILEHRDVAEAVSILTQTLGVRAIALAGMSAAWAGAKAGTTATGFDSLFHAFHRAVADGNVLQLRAHGAVAEVAASALGPKNQAVSEEDRTTLWVKAPLPPALDLGVVSQLIGAHDVRWGQAPTSGLQGIVSREGYAELYLSTADLHRLVSNHAGAARSREITIAESTAYLRRHLLESKGEIAAAGSELYRPPHLGELVYLDVEVVAPLVALIDRLDAGQAALHEAGDELSRIAWAAGRLGLRLTVLNSAQRGTFVMLGEERGGTRRYWGTAVFRVAAEAPVLIQVPRPLLEANTLEAALTLFDGIKARALVIAGADSRANRDGSADLTLPKNMRNMLNLVSQVVLRDMARRPVLVVQTRGYGAHADLPPINADVVMTASNGARSPDTLSPPARMVMKAVESWGLRVQIGDGDAPGAAGLLPGSLPQARYLDQAVDAEMALLWLSPSSRDRHRELEDRTAVLAAFDAAFDAAEIGSEEAVLSTWVSRHPFSAKPPSPALRSSLGQFVRTRDVAALWNARTVAEKEGTALVRLVDAPTRKMVVAVLAPSGETQGMVHLSPLGTGETRVPKGRPRQDDREAIEAFVEGRSAWLLPGAGE